MSIKTKRKRATLYRTVTDDHICPHGIRCKDLLRREGFDVDDQHLVTPEEVDALKSLHNVLTVPQVFIGGSHIGGFDNLRTYFGKAKKLDDAVTYQPIMALFSVGFLLATGVTWLNFGVAMTGQTIEWFISI